MKDELMKKNLEELIDMLFESIKDSNEEIPFLNFYERAEETQREKAVC